MTNQHSITPLSITPLSFEEALARTTQSPPFRKIKTYIDNTDLSADMKAILHHVAKYTVKIGEVVIDVGRRIFAIAFSLIQKFPNTSFGVLMGLVVGFVLDSTVGGMPVFSTLAELLSKLVMLLGVSKGFFEDLRPKMQQADIDCRIKAEFDALRMGGTVKVG